jgi:predicted amidohydrolase YtcJ
LLIALAGCRDAIRESAPELLLVNGTVITVTPFAARYGLWAAVAREPALGIYGGDPFGRDEAIDIHAALRASTIWAAHQMFLDTKIGSIKSRQQT